MNTEQELLQTILGDVASNEEYGLVMKKWRELFNVTQAMMARELRVKPSVISDYESSRRKSPGITFIRGYVQALLKTGQVKDKASYDSVAEMLKLRKAEHKLLLTTFSRERTAAELLRLLDAKRVTKANNAKIKGSVFFSSNITSVLTELPTSLLFKHLKAEANNAYLFSNVKSGRAPIVLLSLFSKINRMRLPALIVLQSKEFKMSNFARKFAEKNNITLAVTSKDVENIRSVLESL